MNEAIDELNEGIKDTWGSDKLFCNFCKSKPAQLMQYKYKDGSGEGSTYFCHTCWNRYEDEERVSLEIPNIKVRKADFTYFNPLPKPQKKKK